MAPRKCTFSGCGKPHHANGLCDSHNQAQWRKRAKCKLTGCNRTHGRSGPWYCRPHEHHAFIKQGNVKTQANLAKFRLNIEPDEKSGCWMWQGGRTREDFGDGYGLIHATGTTWLAHRFSFVLFNGGHAQGKQLDHLCNRTLCVRPDHLQPVTDKTNSRRRNKRNRLGDLPYWQDSVVRPTMGAAHTADGLRPPGGNLMIWAMFNGLPLTKPGVEMAELAPDA